MSLDNVKHIILVLSGKGGVGKSSVTVQLALSLARRGHSVGVLDIDLTGPNIPRMFAVESAKVQQSPAGWIPVRVSPASTSTSTSNGDAATPASASASNGNANGDASAPAHGTIDCMSLGFLLRSRNDSVVWRGPKKTAMIRQFLTDVRWGALDYLLIDTPPGTSDEHISLAEQLRTSIQHCDGAVLVTTPQAVATADVRKELNFCRKVGIAVLGVVENMSGFVCPHCSECTNVFSSGGGRVMASEFGVEFLGEVPIDPGFGRLLDVQDAQSPLVERYAESGLCSVFAGITERLVAKVEPEPGAADGAEPAHVGA